MHAINTTLVLLHLSTDYVFDGAQAHPYVESDTPNPINVYGKTKAEGEQRVLTKAQKGYVIRTAWLYATTHGYNFYRSILSKAQAGDSLSVVNDQVGSPTTTVQLALFLIQIVKKAPPLWSVPLCRKTSFILACLCQTNLSRASTQGSA